MTSADDLFERNLGWAEQTASRFMRRYRVPRYLSEAIVNSARIGLWQASKCFRAPGNFRWFASRRIWGAMLDELECQMWGCVPISDSDAVTHETGLSALEARETGTELMACRFLEEA